MARANPFIKFFVPVQEDSVSCRSMILHPPASGVPTSLKVELFLAACVCEGSLGECRIGTHTIMEYGFQVQYTTIIQTLMSLDKGQRSGTSNTSAHHQRWSKGAAVNISMTTRSILRIYIGFYTGITFRRLLKSLDRVHVLLATQ